MAQWINLNHAEYQICGSALIFCTVRKNWAHTPTASGSYNKLAGWLYGRQNVGGFQNFKILYRLYTIWIYFI